MGNQQRNNYSEDNHQWMLKLVGKGMMKMEYLHGSKVSLHKILIDNREDSYFTLEREGGHQGKKAITFIINSDGANLHNVPFDMMSWKEQ